MTGTERTLGQEIQDDKNAEEHRKTGLQSASKREQRVLAHKKNDPWSRQRDTEGGKPTSDRTKKKNPSRQARES